MKDRCVAALDEIGAVCRQPICSLFQGAESVVFEAPVLDIRDRPGVTPAAMRPRHTTVE